ncbi:MAG: type II toxin-antitoxin system RelE/ParE family toxin [Fluviicola sp.]
MTIIWSDEEIKDFEQNIAYLLENWPENVVIEFTQNVEIVLSIITINPYAFRKSNVDSKIRIALTVKQISLFYEIKKDRIYLLRFWNNYKDVTKNKFI